MKEQIDLPSLIAECRRSLMVCNLELAGALARERDGFLRKRLSTALHESQAAITRIDEIKGGGG